MNVTHAVPLKTAHVNLAASASAFGATTLVASPGAARIRVLQVAMVATAATTVKFQSNATDISAGWPLGANGGLVLPFNEHGWFETAVGESLNINLSAATAVGIQIQYIVLGS